MRQPNEILINGMSLDVILADHKLWVDGKGGKRVDLQGTDLQGADLRDANLQYADLRGADLRGADLDFSCMPLWCCDLKAHYDDKQIIQQLYHVLSHVKNSKNASDELKELLSETNLKFANRFHRVGECGELEV
jgi:hypothetical protein